MKVETRYIDKETHELCCDDYCITIGEQKQIARILRSEMPISKNEIINKIWVWLIRFLEESIHLQIRKEVECRSVDSQTGIIINQESNLNLYEQHLLVEHLSLLTFDASAQNDDILIGGIIDWLDVSQHKCFDLKKYEEFIKTIGREKCV